MDDSAVRGTFGICLVAVVGGACVGVVAGAFRWCLLQAVDIRVSVLHRVREMPGPVWLVPVVVVAGCAAAARYVVRRVPAAAGSGVQDVEAIWRGEAEPATGIVLPAKFVGGLLAIGSGMALGREGPTVHMGAVIGSEAGRWFRTSTNDRRILQAAFGGAGLAVAFNAPLGGALFVFEEVSKSFRTRLALATLISCATAIAVSRTILPDTPDFVVSTVGPLPTW